MKKILFIGKCIDNYHCLVEKLIHINVASYYTVSLDSAAEMLEGREYSLIVMDITLSTNNYTTGFDFISHIRKLNDIPIIIVSQDSDISNKIKALQIGADDYITVPFAYDECVARIVALMRRYYKTVISNEWEEIRYGNFSISPIYRKAQIDGKEIPLTSKEFDLLYLLARNRGRVFTKDQLYTLLWDEPHYATDNSIMCQIHKLRKKLNLSDSKTQYIQTVHGIGYRFQCDG